ncbi:hypothetical protein Bca52824_035041 [Brassica carinata]|uniref:Glycoside hydrolase family 3 N-terminal domain-containing protein n=1 Tax=Brassica carinata TaxID=52824 RepID=A0A8X7S6W8_BRACI|nr:hypothetical protein Bca52824_035041 [Brassica carinata]
MVVPDKGLKEGNTIASYEDLEKIHIPPYLKCLAQGVPTVMASYFSWNGSNLLSNYFLLTEVLKGKLDLKGFIILDWEGLDRLSEPWESNYPNCGQCWNYEHFVQDMTDLVESGEIPMARVNDAVEGIHGVKFVAGLF